MSDNLVLMKNDISKLSLYEPQSNSICYALDFFDKHKFSWIKEVILFGSCINGSVSFDSDVDLLVVMQNNLNNEIRDTMRTIKSTFFSLDYPYAEIDVKFFTEDYFNASNSIFKKSVVEEGVIIWKN